MCMYMGICMHGREYKHRMSVMCERGGREKKERRGGFNCKTGNKRELHYTAERGNHELVEKGCPNPALLKAGSLLASQRRSIKG